MPSALQLALYDRAFNSLFGIPDYVHQRRGGASYTFNSLFGIRAYIIRGCTGRMVHILSTPFSGFLHISDARHLADLSTPFSGFIVLRPLNPLYDMPILSTPFSGFTELLALIFVAVVVFQLPFRDSPALQSLNLSPLALLSTPFSGFCLDGRMDVFSSIEPFNSLFGIRGRESGAIRSR